MTPSPRLSVITKSNRAAAALQQGRHRDAMNLVRLATKQLNEIYQQGGDTMVNEGSMTQTSAAAASSAAATTGSSRRQTAAGKSYHKAFPLRSCPVASNKPGAAANMIAARAATRVIEDEDCSAMFRRAIVVSRKEECLPLIAAVTLYNLALCEHVLGKHASSLKFYKMAYQIIEENRELCLFGDLLVLAVINNIADACAQLFEIKKSRRWFDFLGRILGITNSRGRILPALDEDDFLFFYINAMLHQGNALALAPAA